MYIILIIIVLIIIYRQRFKPLTDSYSNNVGESLIESLRGEKRYVGKRVVGYTIRPMRDIIITHLGMPYIEDDAVSVGIFKGDTELESKMIHRNDGGDFGFAKISPLKLLAGQDYHLVGMPDSQPVVDMESTNHLIGVVGRCWRLDNNWGPPTICSSDKKMVVGPNIKYSGNYVPAP